MGFCKLEVKVLTAIIRTRACKGDVEGISKNAWALVTESGRISLNLAMVEDIVDQQSDGVARTYFSPPKRDLGFYKETYFIRMMIVYSLTQGVYALRKKRQKASSFPRQCKSESLLTVRFYHQTMTIMKTNPYMYNTTLSTFYCPLIIGVWSLIRDNYIIYVCLLYHTTNVKLFLTFKLRFICSKNTWDSIFIFCVSKYSRKYLA